MEDWLKKNAITYRQSMAKIAANKQGQDIINGTSGNSFDEFGGVTPIRIEGGKGAFGVGATPATATGFGPYTVSYSSTGLKTITLIATSGGGSDTLVRTNYVNVTAVAPPMPGYINGPLGLCGLLNTNITYSCPIVNGATDYNWTVPSGCNIISGQLTNVLVVNFQNGFTTGNITVNASNACGTSSARS